MSSYRGDFPGAFGFFVGVMVLGLLLLGTLGELAKVIGAVALRQAEA